MYRIGIIAIIIFGFLFLDWHARMVFIAIGYPGKNGHGKSWKRASKHYKKNNSFLERILWRVVFKESYDSKYRWLAYLSYIHMVTSIFTITWFLISVSFFPNSKIWITVFACNFIFSLLRFIYDNAIARGEI